MVWCRVDVLIGFVVIICLVMVDGILGRLIRVSSIVLVLGCLVVVVSLV